MDKTNIKEVEQRLADSIKACQVLHSYVILDMEFAIELLQRLKEIVGD